MIDTLIDAICFGSLLAFFTLIVSVIIVVLAAMFMSWWTRIVG